MNTNGPLLTSEEVAALVEAAHADDHELAGGAASGGAYSPYDLVSNDTTSRSQLAALEMVEDRFARQLRGDLLTLLRQAVRISQTQFEVTTFGKYLQSLPSPCNVNIVRYPPLRGYGLITIDPSIVYGAVDSFFGGQGGGEIELSPQRGFTPTEERIIQIILDTIFSNLKESWAPVYSLNPEYVSREINPSFAQVGEERETVIVSRFDMEVGPNMKGQLTIMYPFSALIQSAHFFDCEFGAANGNAALRIEKFCPAPATNNLRTDHTNFESDTDHDKKQSKFINDMNGKHSATLGVNAA